MHPVHAISRIAMYCAVHSPIPASERNCSIASSRLRCGPKISGSATTAAASDDQCHAPRRGHSDQRPDPLEAIRAGVGNTCVSPSASARRFGDRLAIAPPPACPPASSAAATEICCPSMARTASSNPSHAPGTRSPGRAATSGASTGSSARCAPIATGSAARSNTRRTRAMIAGRLRRFGNAARRVRQFAVRALHRKHAAGVAERDGPRISVARHDLDARDCARAQERQDRVPVVRRPISQLDRHRACRADRPRPAPAAAAPSAAAVHLLKHLVEPPDAAETCRRGDLASSAAACPGSIASPAGSAASARSKPATRRDAARNSRRSCRSPMPSRSASASTLPHRARPPRSAQRARHACWNCRARRQIRRSLRPAAQAGPEIRPPAPRRRSERTAHSRASACGAGQNGRQ